MTSVPRREPKDGCREKGRPFAAEPRGPHDHEKPSSTPHAAWIASAGTEASVSDIAAECHHVFNHHRHEPEPKHADRNPKA
jgi:hypothetical protein